jgi:hypothetical protein
MVVGGERGWGLRFGCQTNHTVVPINQYAVASARYKQGQPKSLNVFFYFQIKRALEAFLFIAMYFYFISLGLNPDISQQ